MCRSFGAVAVLGTLLSIAGAPVARANDWKPKVDALVKPAVESGVVVGISIGIVYGDKSQTFGYGKASTASQQSPDETTLFEIGSVTKVFTALALADMAREKLVSLDDPVRKWLPESVKVPSRDGKEVTLTDLSTHASGLPRLGRILETQALRNPLNPYAQFTTDELYATLASSRLATTPGAKYAYSNLGVGLLGHVLARRAGLTCEELIQRRICAPLGMTETRIALPDAWKSRLAEGHDIDGNPLPPWDIITLAACGGLHSNVRDLVRFVRANLGVLKSPLTEAIETTHRPRLDIGPNEAICLGWHLRKAEGTVWHNGQTGGFHSFVGLRKNPPIGVVVLGNSAGGTVDAIGYRLLDLLAGKEPKPLPLKVPMRVDPAILEQYVGNYELYPNFILSVTRTGDRLWVQATNQPRLGIYPESETKFAYRAVNAQITFVRNKDGKVDKLVLHQHGLDLPAWKGGFIVHFGGQLLKGLKGLGERREAEFVRLLREAGNERDDRRRLGILKQLQTQTGPDAALKADLDRMVAVADRWVNAKLLTDFGAKPYPGLYDLGIAESSPLYSLACLYRARMLVWITLESGGFLHDQNRRRELLDKAVALFKVARAAFPENRVVRMYLGEPIPCTKQYSAPPEAPRWAVLQRENLERLADVVYWWIDHRMQPDGQYGGGWGDDCEMWRFWVPVLVAFDDPKIVAAQARFSAAMMSQPHLSKGYTAHVYDVEHTAEDSADVITPMMHLEPDNPLWQHRARRLAELMENLWTGRNQRGQLQFRSTYFSVDRVDGTPQRACDTVYHPRAVQPALLLWQRTGDPKLGKLFSTWMDTWVDATARSERGKPAGIIPSAIHWPDGNVGGLSPDWWDPRNHGEATLYQWPSAMRMMLDTLLLTYHMTGNEKYLQPIRSMAAIRLKWRKDPPKDPLQPGSEAWCAAQLDLLTGTLAKYRALTGSREFLSLECDDSSSLSLALHAGDAKKKAVTSHRTPEDLPALESSARALRINFEGFTSEVRFTDRVLRFPALFGRDMMFREAIPSIGTPDPSVVYRSASGDPGEAGYFPLARVRWLTPPRDVAARVTAAGPRQFEAELFHFGDQPRSMGAELYLLAPGQYRFRILRAGEDESKATPFSVKNRRTRLEFVLPPKRICILRVESEADS